MLSRADWITAAHQETLWHLQAVAATQLTEQQQRTLLCIRAAYITNAAVLARRRPALTDQLQASDRFSGSTQCISGPCIVAGAHFITQVAAAAVVPQPLQVPLTRIVVLAAHTFAIDTNWQPCVITYTCAIV